MESERDSASRGLLTRLSARQRRDAEQAAGDPEVAESSGPADAGPAVLPLDPGALLAALPLPWIVLFGEEPVAVAPAAVSLGLVRDGRLRHAQLTRAVRAARRAGETVETSLAGTRAAPLPGGLVARCVPVGEGQVLVLIDDRSEALRVDDVRRDFVANVSHELKTPVGALALLAEAVGDAADDPDAVRRFSHRMQGEAHRLAQLVNELIDLSRLQGDDPLSHAQVTSAREVIADAVDQCRLTASARDIDILTTGDTGLLLFGDREQLVMAVRNLVDNAVKYSPPRTRVAVSVTGDRRRVEIAVTDQGIGIAAKDLDRVFERFYRVDPARSRATGGTGLGLSIVKHVVTNHGGDVRVWSVEGAGSTFTMSLPAQAPATPEAPATDEATVTG